MSEMTFSVSDNWEDAALLFVYALILLFPMREASKRYGWGAASLLYAVALGVF